MKTRSMYPLSKYEREYWRNIFSYMNRVDRKRVKQLIRRKRTLAIAEIWGRKPHNPNYWQICTKQIQDIMNYGSMRLIDTLWRK